MIDVRITDYYLLLGFFLIFIRVFTLIISIPIFDNALTIMACKSLFALITSYIFFDKLKGVVLADINHVGINNIALLFVSYAFLGLIVGFMLRCIMQTFVMAGNLVTQHVGLATIRYYSQMLGSGSGVFEQLFNWCLIIVVISSGALLPMFQGMLASFRSLNILNLTMLNGVGEFFTFCFRGFMETAVLLALPIIFSSILMMVVLAITARMVPQMNVLLMSFIINIIMGLLVFLVISNDLFYVAYQNYVEKLGDWFNFVN